METGITVLAVAIIAAIVLIAFLIIRNQKDKEQLNPDSSDLLEEEKIEQHNDRNRI